MLFPDRLEVTNPGPLPKGMTVAKLKRRHKSMPVNPLLAQAMYLRGYIERVGSGTGDIIERCREKGLPPPIWENEDDGLTIVLRRAAVASQPEGNQPMSPQTPPKTGRETNRVPTLKGAAKSVYTALVSDPCITIPGLAAETGLSVSGVRYQMRNLSKMLGLRHEGPTKKGRWVFDGKGKRR